MKRHSNCSRIAVCAGLVFAALAPADTLLIRTGSGQPIPYANAKVLKAEGGEIFFRQSTGNDARRDFALVLKMTIDDEPGFTAAEQAFEDKKYSEAIEGYSKAMQVSDKQWLKDRSAIRVMECAAQVGQFDAAMSAWVYLAGRDIPNQPANKPAIPAAGQSFDSSITEINKALGNSKLKDNQKAMLLGMLIDLYRARKDMKSAGDAMEQLTKLSPDVWQNDPGLVKSMVDLRLSGIKSLLEEKRFSRVLEDIAKYKSQFNDPAQQVEALWMQAEAKNGAGSNTNDSAALKDIALDYMRVVANAKELPGSPHVNESLMRTAQLLAKAKETNEAVLIYQKLANDPTFADASKAKAELDRLTATK